MNKAISIALLSITLPFVGKAQSITWEYVGPDSSTTYSLLTLFDGSVLVSSGSGIFRSDTEGLHWELVDSTLQEARYFVQGSNGTVLAEKSGVISSSDNGMTWSTLVEDQPMHQVAVGHDGTFYYGMGATFFCTVTGCIFLTGGLHQSRDQGSTWSELAFPDSTVSAVSVAENGRLYVTVLDGSDGDFLAYSDDGGATWQRHFFAGLKIRNLVQHPGGALFAATSSGVRRFDQPSQSLQQAGMTGDIWILDGSSSGNLYVYTSTHEGYWSQDEGQTWEPLDLPDQAIAFREGFFVETQSGFVLFGSLAGVYRSEARIGVAVEEEVPAVERITNLGQNYPNPFRISTTIPFSLRLPGHVRVRVVNVLGEQVALLFDGAVPAGEHEVSWFAGETSSGVYFYRIESNHGPQTKLLTLVR